MTLYMVGYYENGWNFSGPFGTLADAQNAFNWFQTVGATYTIILSWNTTSVATWGTPPA